MNYPFKLIERNILFVIHMNNLLSDFRFKIEYIIILKSKV